MKVSTSKLSLLINLNSMTHLSRLLLVALALLSFRSSACLNFYVIDSSGHEHVYNEYPPTDIFLRTDYHIKDLEELGSKIPSVSPDEKYKYISNYCALLIKLGRHKDALPILEKLLKEKSNEYEIIANLAVAYELNGQIDKAYESLRKSLSLNRLSHGGSEWFHLNILEAAIKLKNGNLKAKDITILKFPRTDPEMVSHQISYQLKERVPLTSATNDLLSKVIEESAEFFGAKISLEWAIELYAMAIGYSGDEAVKRNLWTKINSSRRKLVNFKKRGKKSETSKYLLRSDWKKEVENIIKRWEGYRTYYYEKKIITRF